MHAKRRVLSAPWVGLNFSHCREYAEHSTSNSHCRYGTAVLARVARWFGAVTPSDKKWARPERAMNYRFSNWIGYWSILLRPPGGSCHAHVMLLLLGLNNCQWRVISESGKVTLIKYGSPSPTIIEEKSTTREQLQRCWRGLVAKNRGHYWARAAEAKAHPDQLSLGSGINQEIRRWCRRPTGAVLGDVQQ